ncbi:MAG: polyprenyl synthetase family protein [Bacteroidales bacterium]|nr:polyprenyl synthetase family protein [Bacteroidales bacterium]
MALREEIIKPIKDSIGEFNLLYEGLSDSGIKLLDDMLTHVGQTRGKQLRPTLLLLIAGAFGNMSDKAVRAALAVETLHITTLIHDDVVDESLLRRGKQTLNSIWGNKLAVLAGDYLYAKALNILVDIEDNEILKTISRVAQEMGEGELLQQENAREYNLTEEKYYEVIRKKTAVLFSACCKIGAIVGRGDESEKQKMYEFGQCLGIAFQIQDDILDYSKGLDTGKAYGNDIREQKITLPLICGLRNADSSQREFVENIYRKETITQAEVDNIIDMITNWGGIEQSKKAIDYHIGKAYELLQTLPNNECKQALMLLVKDIAARQK